MLWIGRFEQLHCVVQSHAAALRPFSGMRIQAVSRYFQGSEGRKEPGLLIHGIKLHCEM